MHCQTLRYRNILTRCSQCRCVINNAKSVCIAYEVASGAIGIPTPSVTLYIIGQNGYKIDEIPGTSCDALVNVEFEKEEISIIGEYVDKKTRALKRYSYHNEVEGRRTTVPPTKDIQRRSSTEMPSKRQYKSGGNKFEAEFYVTLISTLLIASFICLAVALYFYKKRSRKIRDGSSGSDSHLHTQNTLNEVETLTNEDEGEYSTIEEIMDIHSSSAIDDTAGHRVTSYSDNDQPLPESDYLEPICTRSTDDYLDPKLVTPIESKYFKVEMLGTHDSESAFLENRKLFSTTDENNKLMDIFSSCKDQRRSETDTLPKANSSDEMKAEPVGNNDTFKSLDSDLSSDQVLNATFENMKEESCEDVYFVLEKKKESSRQK